MNKILRMPQVCDLLSLSRSTIYRLIESGDFPEKIQITPRLVGFRSHDIEAWINSR